MSINERWKYARKKLGLTQAQVGDLVGVSKARISAYEKDEDIPERSINSYCKECGINYIWLVDGVGKPLSEFPKTILDDLAKTYKLSNEAKELVKRFISMPEEKRDVIMELFSPIKKDEQ